MFQFEMNLSHLEKGSIRSGHCIEDGERKHLETGLNKYRSSGGNIYSIRITVKFIFNLVAQGYQYYK